jgi:rSAM/selenodomain-associated transferase 1
VRYPDGRVLIFARAPQAGNTKTRLIPALGARGAAQLHARMIRDTVERVQASGLAPAQLWLDGEAGLDAIASCATAFAGELHLQSGDELGSRMSNALEEALKQAAFAVLIGTDCPVLDRAYLERACALLAAGEPTVFGPAEDGGYVLVGVRSPARQLFEDIAWGTSSVMAQTRQRLAALGRAYRELPVLWDVDRPEDLPRLYALDARWADTLNST